MRDVSRTAHVIQVSLSCDPCVTSESEDSHGQAEIDAIRPFLPS